MPRPTSGFAPSLAVLLAAGLAACSPPPAQQSGPAATPWRSTAGAQGTEAQATSSGVQGHAGHGMAGMDHQPMMAHCAEMRQTVRRGGRLSPDMQGMMAHCDQMDRSMRSSQPR